MNRRDILTALADAGVPRPLRAVALDAIFDVITLGLAAGEDVAIRNFGRFEPRSRREVLRKIPGTDEEVKQRAQRGVGFIPSEALRYRMNRP